MKSFASYLVVMFMVVFWILQVIGGIASTFGFDVGIPIANPTYQIPMIFATFVCILLVIKRSMIGAILYLIIHGGYFGLDLFHTVANIIHGGAGLNDYTSAMLSFMGVALALIAIFEMIYDKNNQKHGGDKKTDWYYGSDEYNRKYDERADKNNYRTM